MIIPNADTLTKEAHDELKACGGTFGSANVGNCSGEAQNRGMTNSADTIIGKVLEVVDRLDPNTYVIYVSDNGTPMYGRANLDFIDNLFITRKGRGKGTAYESGTRVPMAIRGPDIPKGSNTDAYVDSLDLFSTILEFAGLQAPKTVPNRKGDGMTTVDSVSLSPLLFRKAKATRDADKGYLLSETINLMTADRTRQAGARNGAYKIVCTNGYATDECEFFNVLKDPLEEYPLEKPASCADYAAGRWKTSDARWQYCRLNEVLATESFMQPGYDIDLAPGPGLPRE
jgi:arylsulfatase A-like enzyme